MSVQALQVQIDKASADIERQKELLKKLERNKSLLQRQLNGLRDPIARLPLEISSEIFVQSLDLYGSPRPEGIPRLLLQVCNTWSDIALSIPSLWDTLIFTLPRSEDFQKLLSRWFERAAPHLLQVHTRGPLDSGVANVLWAHASQLGHLELFPVWEDSDDSDDDEDVDVEFHQLFGDTPPPDSLPFLHKFTVLGHGSSMFSPLEIRKLLSSSPNLTELCLTDGQMMHVAPHKATETLCLPALRRIWLSRDSLISAPDHAILRFFSAPNLEALGFSIPWTQNNADIISFLQRSSPPLQTLAIDGSEEDFRVFNDIVPFVSTISRLEFEWLEIPFATDLFETLAQHPTTFFPNIDTLKVHSLQTFPPPLWRSLVRAALARRSQLRSMRVTFASTVHVPVPPDVLGSFRTLSETDNGMDIFIGKPGVDEKNMLFS
ncbi:hypothetical protein FB45DRAFT_1125690 [Roridomyces roridus]|uniref:F-box domain-containing protein n=1 Tax=Roridomyces roridus TaxID=1738132 RepID=A0AAD7C866_9AGAR|nr:hypothetical protein FB45DRAFT_1125690 [Roridomyces roridus]